MRQGGRVWYERIKEEFEALGYVRSNADHSVFLKYNENGELTCIIAIYVDDITLASNSLKEITNAKEALSLTFDMTDLGEIGWILGMQFIQDCAHKTITISQERYIKDILKKHGQQGARPMATPLLPNEQLEKLKEAEPDVDVHQYQSTVGALMYAMLGTCPDLAYTVSILSQHTATPGKVHVHVLNCAFWYLQAMAHHTLRFDGNELGELTGFIDADWAANTNDRHSISGYAFMLSGCAINWSSKKQGSVALSSTEAKYIAGAHAAKEAIWLHTLLLELGELKGAPTTLLIDNQSAIAIAKNPAYHAHTKHIAVQHHFLWEKYASRELSLEYVPTSDQVADVLTKGLA